MTRISHRNSMALHVGDIPNEPAHSSTVEADTSLTETVSAFENHNTHIHGAHSSSIGSASSERQQVVQDTLIQSHSQRISQNPQGVQAKFDKLATSPFVFFRGTADLFYQDISKDTSDHPKVLCNGDVHPENFGVMHGSDGELIFGLNDFDEAHSAPFSWDIKRGITGFELASIEKGFSSDEREKITEKFIKGYRSALKDIAEEPDKLDHRFTSENSPKLIKKLLKKAGKKTREEFLQKRIDLESGTFLQTDEIQPVSERIDEFQAVLNDYRGSLGEDAPQDSDFFKVKDVAVKTQSGTGSVGLQRYYVLIEGPEGGDEPRILELKQEENSVMQRHTPPNLMQLRMGGHPPNGERVAKAHDVQVQDGDRFYGHAEIGGQSFLVRERSPHKSSIKLEKLDADEMEDYAKVCGKILAQAHARSAEQSVGGKSLQDSMLQIVQDDAFSESLLDFAKDMGEQVTHDHSVFVKAHQEGAFAFGES